MKKQITIFKLSDATWRASEEGNEKAITVEAVSRTGALQECLAQMYRRDVPVNRNRPPSTHVPAHLETLVEHYLAAGYVISGLNGALTAPAARPPLPAVEAARVTRPAQTMQSASIAALASYGITSLDVERYAGRASVASLGLPLVSASSKTTVTTTTTVVVDDEDDEDDEEEKPIPPAKSATVDDHSPASAAFNGWLVQLDSGSYRIPGTPSIESAADVVRRLGTTIEKYRTGP